MKNDWKQGDWYKHRFKELYEPRRAQIKNVELLEQIIIR
jgi:hypothetical protein